MSGMTRSLSTEEAFAGTDEFLEKLKEGDETAFTEVFHLYKDMVYTLALKLLSDKAESMDVTQEVFLTLFKKIRSFRGECSLKTWLYRVAVNQASNRNRWWKRRSRNRTISLSLAPCQGDGRSHEVPSDAPSPARQCFSAELRHSIDSSLRGLPFEQRVAVILRDVEGLTYEEISEICHAHIGTVKSRIARGREKLREHLEAFQGGEAL